MMMMVMRHRNCLRGLESEVLGNLQNGLGGNYKHWHCTSSFVFFLNIFFKKSKRLDANDCLCLVRKDRERHLHLVEVVLLISC